MNKFTMVLIALVITILVAGCTSPSGCLPMKVDDKQVINAPNIQSLILTISGEDYTYFNPTLDTYSKFEINHTYQMRLQPLLYGKPEVELCGVKG